MSNPENDSEYTSYCGLYCRDCIPSNKEFVDAVRQVKCILEEIQFEKYAEIKSKGDPIFEQYPVFAKLLSRISTIECVSPCRAGGSNPGCKIRECNISRNFTGCWECNDRQSCEQLKPLKQAHPNLEYHQELIKEKGLSEWSKHRKGHYHFSQGEFLL
jgi:hypothetical protein